VLLGLPLEEEQLGHHAKLTPQGGFLCLERKGVVNYPSQDKAVVFLEVADLRSFVAGVGSERFVRVEVGATPPWAVLHDPEAKQPLLESEVFQSQEKGTVDSDGVDACRVRKRVHTFGRWGSDAQLIFQICRKCYTIRVSNECD
jgi:hypothetical protein